MEVWAASQPALLASGGCLYGNLLAQRGGEQGESEAVGTRAAPQAQAQVPAPRFYLYVHACQALHAVGSRHA